MLAYQHHKRDDDSQHKSYSCRQSSALGNVFPKEDQTHNETKCGKDKHCHGVSPRGEYQHDSHSHGCKYIRLRSVVHKFTPFYCRNVAISTGKVKNTDIFTHTYSHMHKYLIKSVASGDGTIGAKQLYRTSRRDVTC